MAARAAVKKKISEEGVHPFLVINIDQVWRQTLRFSKTLFQQGKQRILAVQSDRLSVIESFCALYSHDVKFDFRKPQAQPLATLMSCVVDSPMS